MRGSDFRPGGRAAVLAACAALAAAGCGEEPAERLPETGTSQAADSAAASATTPARYVTTVAFASPDSAAGLLLRLEQTTGPGSLRRRYEGWLLSARRWRSVLSLSDTVPVPRARWRVLPGGGLRLEVATGGEITAYRLRSGELDVRLELGELSSSWPSPTGQRERLRRARLRAGDDTFVGLAVVRRSALPMDGESPGASPGFLLLAISDREGLVVTLPHDGPGPAVAYGRIADRVGPWDSISVELPEAAAGGSVRLAGGSIEIGLEPLGRETGGAVLAVRGSTVGPDRRPVRGLLVRSRGPR